MMGAWRGSFTPFAPTANGAQTTVEEEQVAEPNLRRRRRVFFGNAQRAERRRRLGYGGKCRERRLDRARGRCRARRSRRPRSRISFVLTRNEQQAAREPGDAPACLVDPRCGHVLPFLSAQRNAPA